MSLFYKEALTPFMRALPSCYNYIPTPHLLIASHWGLGFQHINFKGGHKHPVSNHIQHLVFVLMTLRDNPQSISWFHTPCEQKHELPFGSRLCFQRYLQSEHPYEAEQRVGLLIVTPLYMRRLSPPRVKNLEYLFAAH